MVKRFLVGYFLIFTFVISGCSESRTPSSSSVPASSSVSYTTVTSNPGAKDVARLYNTTEKNVNDVVGRAAQLGGTSNEKMMEAMKAASGE